MNQKIKIVQWNIRSIIPNRIPLLSLIWNHDPDVILINETWLKSQQDFHINNYNIIRDDRTDGYGGIAVLIRKNVNFQQPKLNIATTDNIQYAIIKIQELYIVTLYIPKQNKNVKKMLEEIHNKLDGQYILMGDLNARSRVWGCSDNNSNGNQVGEFINENDLHLLNDGTPTRINLPNQNPTTIDLAITNTELAHQTKWEVISDCGHSDHYPTVAIINPNKYIKPDEFIVQYQKKRNLKKADWSLYGNILEGTRLNGNNLNFKTLDDNVKNAANIAIPYFKPGNKRRTGNPWWDQECSEKITERKIALQEYKNAPSIENFIIYKHTLAKTKRFLKKKENRFHPILWNSQQKFRYHENMAKN